jgi:hypothetical protein
MTHSEASLVDTKIEQTGRCSLDADEEMVGGKTAKLIQSTATTQGFTTWEI